MTYWQMRGNKYHSKTCEYGGNIYHSMFEASYAKELDLRVKAKDIKSWDRQVPLHLYVNGHKICTYTIDFVVHENDGSRTYVECKGFETRDWALKWKLAEALLGDIDPDGTLLLVKQ